MGCEASQCSKTSTPKGIFIVTLSLEGWPTKAKEVASLDEVKTGPAGHQPSILMSPG